MSAVAEPRAASGARPAAGAPSIGGGAGAAPAPRPQRPWAVWSALALVLAGSLALRVWGVDHGLPYAYNADENAHFVPRAIGIFNHAWNPDYFVNPPAYTYVLHLVFTVWFGGREGVSRVFASDPTQVWIVARVTAGVLGTLSIWLLYVAGARLVDRRVGLLAAGLMAVAFLPVFYSKLALNDVPTLAPLCLALVGLAGVLRRGRARDYALAGIGLGLACATKYTGGIVLVALAAAILVQFAAPGGKGHAVRGAAIAAAATIAAFVVANPYVVLDPAAVIDGITHQSTAADDAQGKLGITRENGWAFYLWAATWGLGWVPLVAAVLAVPLLLRDERRLVWVLVPAPLLFIAFMGTQERYFGRWLLPVFPFLCLLAAYAALRVADRLSARHPALRPTLVALAAVALCGQGLVYTLHSGQVLSREDTRNLAREWMVTHVPPRTNIVVEPVVPDAWAQDPGNPSRLLPNGNRWNKFATSRSRRDPDDPTGPLLPPPGVIVNVEDYERVLAPDLVRQYERLRHCWVVVGSTQRGRAEAEPEEVPMALAFYRELEARSRLAYEASPYDSGKGPVRFSFDWTFNYYPMAYHRPGPVMSVYRLTRGRCAS
jgi:4-amino-4-deoxy-L-arabinose transferase-like glycosyltransferase